MKWHKFKKLVAENPWLVDVVDPLGYLRHDVETSSIREGFTPELRRFVRQQLEYVTFRPWNTLDLLATRGGWETSMTLEYAVRCDPHYGGSPDAQYLNEWDLVWHVGDDPSRPTPHREGFAIRESMIEIQIEHAEGRFGKGDLCFEFIVKRIIESTTKTSRIVMAIEIFQVPYFLLKPINLAPGVVSPTKMREDQLLTYREQIRSLVTA